MTEAGAVRGPDLREGVALDEVPEGGVLAGHVGEEAVLLYRSGTEVSAVAATCTHYSGPLAEGLVQDGEVRCPWHHACFSLRTGEALRAPALASLARWRVEVADGVVRVGEKLDALQPEPLAAGAAGAVGPAGRGGIVVVGFGAAGSSAVEWLLRDGWQGGIDVVEPDADAPYDRPNLSKDYLAGTAQEEWLPLRPRGWYEERGVVVHRVEAREIDGPGRRVLLADGSALPYQALLLATGARPIRITLVAPEGAERVPSVHYLRSLADSRGLIAAAESGRRAVVLGASFIGLEVAASLRTRGLEVAVVAPEALPFQRVLGPELGRRIQRLHEEHGVQFHLQRTASGLAAGGVRLDDGSELPADLVVVGVGVRPALELASSAGAEVGNGVMVDERLRTSVAGIWAAGDIARYPDPLSGEPTRVEHWVVAQRQGAAAARDMMGRGADYRDVPFFWSQHYDLPINYVGHAASWDAVSIAGDVEAGDCAVAYKKDGRTLALATIYRDLESLETEVTMEQGAMHV